MGKIHEIFLCLFFYAIYQAHFIILNMYYIVAYDGIEIDFFCLVKMNYCFIDR